MMQYYKPYLILITGVLILLKMSVYAQQIVINEVQSGNISTLTDFTGNTPDWLEITNRGPTAVNLLDYALTDKRNNPRKWTFPSVTINPGEYILVYASGLDIKKPPLFWETVIDKGTSWRFMLPIADVPGAWNSVDYNDAAWQQGPSGIGYGDNDDATTVSPTLSLLLRKKFSIANVSDVAMAWLHIDYDDGFIAYLNGAEIARANVDNTFTSPPLNQQAAGNHEALMYQGLEPEGFVIDSVYKYLRAGDNVLSIRVFNQSIGSSDLTAIPFLSLGYTIDPGRALHQSTYFGIPQSGLHTNFKIDSERDSIYLSNTSGAFIDSVQVVIPANYSYGRRIDQQMNWAFFAEPTPGSANVSEAYSGQLPGKVQFSVSGGFKLGPVSLTLTALGAGDSIYYTLDGTEPGFSSILFTQPIGINSNAVIRARILKKGLLPGAVSSQTYLFGQTHDLPVVAITTSPDNLWDEDYGIYVKGKNASATFPYHGANFWQDWERPASLSLYETDGIEAFQVNGGVKIFGNYSRGNDQKSLAFHVRKVYGDEQIDYKIFGGLDIDQFESIVIRNSGNDFNNTMMRDAFCTSIVASLGLDQLAYRPAVAYINGAYWGIMNIREKMNESYLEAHHDVDRENIDVLENNGWPVVGSAEHYHAMMSFINSNNLALKANYDFVKKQMDVDNYIKYLVAQIFIDNRDWPGNNIKFWRERSPAGKWRWILYDLDFGFNTWANDNQNFNTLAFALATNGPNWPNPPWSTLLFRKLLENQSFKNNFINCFADQLNTIFRPQVLLQTIEQMKTAIDSEMPRHLARWNGSIYYRNERVEAMREFARSRQYNVRQHIRTQFGISGTYNVTVNVQGQGNVQVNSVEPDSYPWSGVYFGGIPINVRALPAPGYRFTRWEGVPAGHSELLTLTEYSNKQITAIFEPTEVNVDDIVINEINYSSVDTFDVGDWVELHNISGHDINISGWKLKDAGDNEFTFPTGTIIARGEFLVVCKDLKAFGYQFADVPVVPVELGFGLSAGGDCISLMSSSGIRVDEVCYTNYSPWPIAANGGGSTLSLIDPYSRNDVAENWVASSGNGTPGARNNNITGIAESMKPAITLFPNPATESVTVYIENQGPGIFSASITDMAGRQSVLSEKSAISPGQNELTFDIHHFPPGIYLLLINCKGEVSRHKLIIGR